MQQSFTIGRLLVYWFLLLAGIAQMTPVFSQGYVDDGKRYAMYTLYHYGDRDGSTQERQIRGMKDAFANGCNSVVIGIAWDVLQPNMNSAPNWAYIDRFVQVAQQYNAKIAIRLRTCRQDRTGYWPDEQSMKDTRGNIMQVEGTTHSRLGYTPAIDKIQDFVRSAAQRYKYLNDRGELLFMSVTFNPQWENEYWYMNFPDQNLTSYDFNELTIGDFQRWALAKYNGSLDAVNRTWGTAYRTATDIRPTYPDNNLRAGYQGKRGEDWYTFRHLQLKSFNDRFARTVKEVDPTIRIVTEQGSVYDAISGNRGTLGFKNLAELYDGIKVNDGPTYVHQFSMDLLRSNMKPGGWVINEVDGAAYRDPGSTAALAEQIEASFKYGAKIVTFANYFLEFNQEDQLRTLLAGMRAKRLLEQPVPTITPVATMSYKLSSLVQSNVYETGIFAQWNTLRGGNDGKPVRILLDEDILTGVSAPPQNQVPTVVNRIPNQTTLVDRPFSFKIPDNTFADADGQITSVTLSGLPAGLNYNAATRTISGTPVVVGSSELTIKATDNNNASVTDFFTLAVRRATLPLQLLDPVLDCTTGRFEFRSTEGDGSTVEYAMDNVYSWNAQTIYTLAEPLRSGSSLTIRARQNGTELSLNYRTTCPASTSGSANRPPVVAIQLPDQGTAAGQPFIIILPANVFTDPDGTIASVSLSGMPPGIIYSPATRVLEGTSNGVGVWTITVTATDDKGATVSTTFKLTLGSGSINKPLRLLDPLLNCTTGLLEFRSADGDGTPIEYSIDRVVNWSTQTSFVVPLSARYNEQFDIKARQSGQLVSSVYRLGCLASNQFPTVRATISNQTLTQFQSMSLVIPATTFADTDGTINSISLTGLPPGLTYAANTTTLSGVPTVTGTWTVTATAMDNQGASVSTTFVITVIAQIKPLRLLDPLIDCATGRFEFRSADGDGTPVEYAADDLYSLNTRAVYTLAEQFRSATRITIRARQSGINYIAYYTTTCAVINKAPVINMAIANQTGVVNKPVSFLIPAGTFTDTDGQIASVVISGLPASLSYDPVSRLITGIVAATSVWTITATATDDKGASTSVTFTITIGRDFKPLRLLDPVLNCDTGLFEFRSVDGDGTPIEYSIDRVVDWSTQSSFTMAVGPRYNEQLDIKARQSGQIISSVYRPACPQPNQLPTVKTTIPNQTLTQFRNTSLVIPPATFADADGTIALISLTGLPPGLTYAANTLNVSGAPTVTGSWTVTVVATDNRGGKVAITFVITVIPQVKPLRLLAPVVDCATGILEFQTADGDGTAIGYSIDRILDWTSQSVYTLAEGPRYGTVLTLRVRQSGVEQTLTFTTPCVRLNKPPVVAIRIPDQVLIVNQPASVTLPANTFADPDGTITSVTLTGLPVGISYDPFKRTIQGTPTLIGTSPAVAKATDNAGASVSDTFLITVRVAPRFAVTTTLLDVQGRVLKDLIDADLLDIKKMPLLANLSCQPKVAAGSVLMELTGKAKRTVYANAAPYLLYPSGQGFKPEVGSYQLKLSVFSGANGTGTLLGTSTVRFDVVIANEGG